MILLFATFVAYPYQSAIAHESPKHDFCFDSTLNAFDFLDDWLFALIDFVTFLLFGPPKPPLAALLKTFVSLAILGGGAALSLVCAPQVMQPSRDYRVYLSCNYAGFKDTDDEDLIGYKVQDSSYKGDGDSIKYFGAPFRYWNDDATDDRVSLEDLGDTQTTYDASIPILGSFRHSLYTTEDDSKTRDVKEGERLGFTTFYAAESSFVWLSFTAGLILSLLIKVLATLFPGAAFLNPSSGPGKVLFSLFEIALNIGLAVVFATVGNYKTLIRDKDPNAGIVSHPVLRDFEIFANDNSPKISDDSKLFELGANTIEYTGGAKNHAIDDNEAAKFYFNVVDPFPPFLGLAENNVTLVEANAHWGFIVEPKEYSKMGYPFLSWDNCNQVLDPVFYQEQSKFIPLAILGDDEQKFRDAWKVYKDEFSNSKDKTEAKKAYLQIADITQQDKDDFNRLWTLTDHPEGYSIWSSAGLTPDDFVKTTDSYSANATDYNALYDDSENIKILERLGKSRSDIQRAITAEEILLYEDQIFNETQKILDELNQDSPNESRDCSSSLEKLYDCYGGSGAKGIGKLLKVAAKKTLVKDFDIQKAAKRDLLISQVNNEINSIEARQISPPLGEKEKRLLSNPEFLKLAEESAATDAKRLKDLKEFKKRAADLEQGKTATKSAAAIKVIGLGIGAAVAFTQDDSQPDPTVEKINGMTTWVNQTVIVIDTTPPDVLVPGFEAIYVDPPIDPDGVFVKITPPLIFDVADPSPDLFYKLPVPDNNGPICYSQDDCGYFPLGDEDVLDRKFKLGISRISWFGEDYSGNKSPIREQIANIKQTGTNQLSIATDNFFNVGGFGFNPQTIEIQSNNTDNDPVKYLLQSSPDFGILKSPLDPVFQNKIQETGKTSFLRGLSYISSDNLVFFPDSLNNRVMKVNVTEISGVPDGTISVGFNFTTDAESPASVVPSQIEPRAISSFDAPPNCDYRFFIGDWNAEKIYDVELCDISSQTSIVKDVYDVGGLFSNPQYLDYDGSTLYLTDADLGSIIATTLKDIENPSRFNSPTDVLSLKNDEVWIADSLNARVLNFDVGNKVILSDFNFTKKKIPSGIATNGTDLFIALNTKQNNKPEIQIFNLDNSTQTPSSITITQNLDIERLAISDDIIYATDKVNDKIHKFNTSGYLSSFGKSGSDDNEFLDPTGLTINQTNLYVADSGNNRIVKIDLNQTALYESNYSSGWMTFGSNVTVQSSSNTGVNFENTSTGKSAEFSGAYQDLGITLPSRSWVANFTLKTGTNTENSTGYLWLVTNSLDEKNPSSDNFNGLGLLLDSSKLYIYQKNSTDSLNSTQGTPIENNSEYNVSLTRHTQELVTLSVKDSSGETILPTLALDISANIDNLLTIQHSNNIEKVDGDSLNVTISDTRIDNIKFSWLGGCTGGPNCVLDSEDPPNGHSDGFLCTDSTCDVGSLENNENGQLLNPLGITYNNENFYVTDSGNYRIQVFNSSGNFVKTFGNVTILGEPSGISLDNNSNVYVADSLQDSIIVFDQNFDHETISQVITQDEFFSKSETTQFKLSTFNSNITAISKDSIGNTWVLDTVDTPRLINLKNSTNIGNVIEEIDLTVLDIANPSYFAIDNSDKFFLVDNGNKTVITFELDGQKVDEESIVTIDLSGNFTNPVGIEIEEEYYEIDQKYYEYAYISDWDENNEKIIKIEADSLESISMGYPFDIIDVSNMVQNPKDIGIVDSLHPQTPKNVTRIVIADEDEFGPKLVSFRTDLGIIDNKTAIVDSKVHLVGMEYGPTNYGQLYAMANNGTLFSYYPWNQVNQFEKIIDLNQKASGIAFNPVSFIYKNDFTYGDDPDTPLLEPRGMAFGPDGHLYVAGWENVINKYNGTTGEYIETFTKKVDGPYGIAFHPETGNLFVGNYESGLGCIKEYDDKGKIIREIDCSIDWGMGDPRGMAFNSEGILFVSSYDSGSVMRFNLELFDEKDQDDDGVADIKDNCPYLANPLQTDDNDDGVGDICENVSPPQPEFLESLRTAPFVDSNTELLQNPNGLAIDQNDNIYVVDTSANKVIKFDPQGNHKVFADPSTLNNPIGIFYAAEFELENGTKTSVLYVSNKNKDPMLQDNVKVFDLNGNVVKTIVSDKIENPYYLTANNPSQILVGNNDGTIANFAKTDTLYYLPDWSDPNNPIYAFSSNGTLNSDETIFVNATNPGSIATDSMGNLYVTDYDGLGGKIHVIERLSLVQQTISLNEIVTNLNECIPIEDNPVFCQIGNNPPIPVASSSPVKLDLIPSGLSIDSEDSLFISDWVSERIVGLTKSGTFLNLYKFNNTFNDPRDIAIMSDNENGFANDFNKKLRFSVIDLTSAGDKSEIKSLNYFGLLQEIRDFPEELKSIEGLSRFSEEQDRDESFFSLISSSVKDENSNDSSIAISLSDANRAIGTTIQNTTKLLDFSVNPEGIALYENNNKLAITDWDRAIIHSYTLPNMDLIGTNLLGEVVYPLAQTSEFSDIDIDNDLVIADNFHKSINRIRNVESVPTHNTQDDLTVGDNFIFMKSVVVNEKDELYLLSQENKTLGLYDFRGNLLQGDVSQFDSISFTNSEGVNVENLSNINLLDNSIVSGVLQDEAYVLFTGDLNLKADQRSRNGPVGGIVYGNYTEFVNSEWDNLNWIFFNVMGSVTECDNGTCTNEVFDFPAPNQITIDNDNNRLYHNLNNGKSLHWLDLGGSCSLGHIFQDNSTRGNIQFCLKSGEKETKPFESILEEPVYFENSVYFVTGSQIFKTNTTKNLDNAGAYSWMGKCESGTDCKGIDKVSNGFSCKVEDSGGSFITNSTSCTVSDRAGDRNGQFRDANRIAIDLKTAELFIADFPINIITGESDPRIQKFSEQGFFIEDFISTFSRPELTNDPELLTDQSAGFFDAGNIVGIAKASNYFYVSDERKLHFFDTSPFTDALWYDPERGLGVEGLAFANATYQYFIESGDDSFQYSVTDGFDESLPGTVTLSIQDIDCDDDGIQNSLDPQPGDCEISLEQLEVGQTGGIAFFDGLTYGVINTTQNNQNSSPIRVINLPPPEGVIIESDIENNLPVTVTMCYNVFEFDIDGGDRVIVRCSDADSPLEIFIERGINIQFRFYDSESREASVELSYPDHLTFVPEEYSFQSLTKAGSPKNVQVSFNNEQYVYTNVLGPGALLKVDIDAPAIVCPPTLDIEKDLGLGGIDLTASSQNTLNNIHDWWNYTMSNSIDVDLGAPTRPPTILFSNDTKNFLPLGIHEVEFVTTDGIGNINSCSSLINVRDTTAPNIQLARDQTDDDLTFELSFAPHDDVAVFNYHNLIATESEIFDGPVSFDGNEPQGNVAVAIDNVLRRPTCNPPSGSEFFEGFSPVTCTGTDLSGNTKEAYFNVTSINSTSNLPIGVKIDEAIASQSNFAYVDTITIRFSHETNQPPVTSESQIKSLLNFNGANLGSISAYYLNPSTLVIHLNDPIDHTSLLGTQISIHDNSIMKSASGVLGSDTQSYAILDGDWSKPRTPFITDFIANDPDMEIISNDSEDPRANVAISKGDTMTIRFSDSTNRGEFGNEIIYTDDIKKLFTFSNDPDYDKGFEYRGSWINDRTFIVTIDTLGDPLYYPELAETTVSVKPNKITNRASTSDHSESESWPLTGSFGRFNTIKKIYPEFSLVGTQPSGIITSLKVSSPNIGAGFMTQFDDKLEDLGPVNRIVGNVMDIITDSNCAGGCDLTFTFTSSDNLSPSKARIVHDINGDNIIGSDEVIVPQITINDDVISASTKVFSLSTVALAEKSGGGGGDSTAPDVEEITYSGSGGSGGFSSQDISFYNELEPIIAQTGEEFSFTFTIYENSGIQALQHISLYMNLRGLDDQIHESDTYIRWDKGLPVSVQDPHRYFDNAEIDVFEVGDKIQVVFKFTFASPMETSDVIVRTWDTKRNSWDYHFPNLLTVEGNIINYYPEFEPIDYSGILDSEMFSGAKNHTSIFPEGFIKKWAGFSSEHIADNELLEYLGLEGTQIPLWFKNTVPKWVIEGTISEQEFIDSLRYLSDRQILS